MEKININDCLYFGIVSYHNPERHSIEFTLMSIFESGFIMTRNSLKEKHILSDVDYHKLAEKTCSQGNDAVSIACHPTDTTTWLKHKFGRIMSDEDAYSCFICGNNPVLILNSTILKDLKFKTTESLARMVYELQVIGDIPIEYVIAIGLQDALTKDITNLIEFPMDKKIASNGYYMVSSGLRTQLRENTPEEDIVLSYYESIFKYKRIMEKIKPELLFVDKKSGSEIPTFEEQVEKVKELRKLYLSGKLSCKY